jgi:plasmid maintenance system killer protein
MAGPFVHPRKQALNTNSKLNARRVLEILDASTKKQNFRAPFSRVISGAKVGNTEAA